MAGRVGSAKPRRVQMFLSGGLEDTAACEVSLVSVLLHELSLFMFRGRQQHAVLHAVSLTHVENIHVSTGTLSKQEPGADSRSWSPADVSVCIKAEVGVHR